MLNVAAMSMAQDKLTDANKEISEAVNALGASSAGIEHAAAKAIHASVLLRAGRINDAAPLIQELFDNPSFVESDTYLEVASAHDSFADGAWPVVSSNDLVAAPS